MTKFLLWLVLLVFCWPIALLALLLYPVVIEPKLGLLAQGRWWTIGYLLLIGMIWACARQMPRRLRT